MKVNYYGIRGRCGYLHAACWPAFEVANTRYDAQGWAISRPMIDAKLERLGHAYKQTCIHCGKPLRAASPYTPAGIRAGFDRSQKAAYRKLKGNARKLGKVLVFDHAPAASPGGWELALILPAEADDPILLHGRTVLFDPRTENALA